MKQNWQIINLKEDLDKKEDLEKKIKECYQKNKDFFGKDISGINIYFVYSRQEMDDLLKRKTPDWLVGNSSQDQITIFSPSIFSQVSSHPDADFIPTLIHEITHAFLREIYKFQYPRWLNEGICGYVAKQGKKVLDFNLILSIFQSVHTNINDSTIFYPLSFRTVKCLIDQYGKDKLFQLLKILKEEESFESFLKKFRQIYQIDFEKIFNFSSSE